MDKKTKVIVLAISALVVIIVVIIAIVDPFKSAEERKTTEYIQQDSPVAISNGSEVYSVIGDRRYLNFRADLRALANSVKVSDPLSTFEVTKVTSSNKSGGSVSFEGRFNGEKDRYSFEIQTRNNDRMEIKAIKIDSKQDVSETLPSNSKMNKYIATLPTEGTDYSINYVLNDGSFVIQLFSDTVATREKAAKELQEGIGVSSLATISYSYFFPTNIEDDPAVTPLQYDDAVEDN